MKGGEASRNEVEKGFELFRIIIYYTGTIKDIEHDLAWRKGVSENDVSVLASFLNRFKRRCYLPVFLFFFFLSPLISAEPSLSLDECTAFNVNQRPVTIASTLLEPRVYFSRVYMCIHIYVYIYIHVRPAFRVYLSPSLAFSRSPGLRSRIN